MLRLSGIGSSPGRDRINYYYFLSPSPESFLPISIAPNIGIMGAAGLLQTSRSAVRVIQTSLLNSRKRKWVNELVELLSHEHPQSEWLSTPRDGQ